MGCRLALRLYAPDYSTNCYDDGDELLSDAQFDSNDLPTNIFFGGKNKAHGRRR
jgi:hypothetical protein